MNSIYIESKTLLENKQAVEWLDGCGAKWGGGRIFSEFKPILPTIAFAYNPEYLVFTQGSKEGHKELTHTPTPLEFCQGVARILGIPEPTFGDEPTISKTETVQTGKEYKAKSVTGGELGIMNQCNRHQAITSGTNDDLTSARPFAMPLRTLDYLPVILFPHKTYRILDSLDGIPLDTRIPLSEWIPPFGERVCFIWGDLFYVGFVFQIDQKGIFVQQDKEGFSKSINLDGHWMRIV